MENIFTDDWRSCTEIKTGIATAMAKEAFNKRKHLLCSNMDLNFRKNLLHATYSGILLYTYSGICILLYRYYTYFLSATIQLHKSDLTKNGKEKVVTVKIEAFEIWIQNRMERINLLDRVSNKNILKQVKEK